MKKCILMAAVAATIFISSCKKDNDDEIPGNITYGNKVSVGNGTARSFLVNKDDLDKMELGLSFDVSAMEGLPATETNFFIDLPQEATALTPYKHVSLDWAPHGHDPNGVYTKPHFDIHFFMISRDEQNAISITNPDLQKLPDSSFLPKFYVPEPGGIDKMGKHWVDITSPELNPVNPLPFTATMIYGTYNGKVVFHEPMVTREFFLSKPDTIMNIRQPDSFAVKSHYPTKYKIEFDNTSRKVNLILSGFEHR